MGKLPKPYRPPTTLSGLYKKYIKTDSPPDDFIREAIREETPTRLMILSLLMRGYSAEQISGAFGNTRQAVDDMARRVMRKAWRRIYDKPRFWKSGEGK